MRKEVFKDDSVGDDLKMCGGGAVLCIIRQKFLAFWALTAFDGRKGPIFYAKGFQAILLSAHVGRSVTVLQLSGGKLLIAAPLSPATCALDSPTSPPFHFTHPSLRFGSAWKEGGEPYILMQKKMGHNMGAQQNCLKAFGIDNWAFSVIKVYQDPKGQKF